MSDEKDTGPVAPKATPKKATPKVKQLADGERIVTTAGGFKFKVRS